jgi:SAM-dependent methyltransferase
MSDADDIRRFYQAGLEAGRLLEGSGVIELARTQDILERHLPPPPARVLDVGGGTGVYARWLAGRGYDVHLVDPSPRHVEEAQAHEGPSLARVAIGDARRLDDADGSADAVLLLGPLYHLVEKDDRLRALAEARRVVRPGGVVVAAAIGHAMPRAGRALPGSSTTPRSCPSSSATCARDNIGIRRRTSCTSRPRISISRPSSGKKRAQPASSSTSCSPWKARPG